MYLQPVLDDPVHLGDRICLLQVACICSRQLLPWHARLAGSDNTLKLNSEVVL